LCPGTKLGKRLIIGGLVAMLQYRWIDMVVMKPLASGFMCFESTPIPQDVLHLPYS